MHLLNNQQRYLPERMHGWGIFPALPAEGHMNRFRLIQYLQEAYASSMQITRSPGDDCDADASTNQAHDGVDLRRVLNNPWVEASLFAHRRNA
jgi:hypothetical protein